MKYIISSCVAGVNCKYNGGNNLNEVAKWLVDEGLAILACPEELGGLPTPRVPAEIIEDKVISKEGVDVTLEYLTGAQKTLQIAKENNIAIAILQKRSPSCGVHQIYDGTHSGILISGKGKTTELLEKHGIQVITIDEYIKNYYDKDLKKANSL